jgi:hypothetical protein
MSPHRSSEEGPQPRPEWLAGYADSEVDAATRDLVDGWLAAHPEASAEVQAQRQITRVYRTAPLPEPTAPEWQAVLAAVEAELVAPSRRRTPWLRRMLWLAAGLAAAAAILLAIGFLLPRANRPVDQRTIVEAEPEAPLPVVTAADVAIISMEDDGGSFLIVGEPPVREALALAGPGDVEVSQVTGDAQGMNPQYMNNGSPMIIMVPREPAPEKTP